jgi:hypothetical protein
MSDAAYEEMRELRDFLHDLANASGGVSSGFQSFVGKLHGVAGNLTLIQHITEDPDLAPFQIVSVETVRKVDQLIREFILPHGLALYDSIGSNEFGERIRKIASYILTSGKTEFTAHNFTNNVRQLRNMSVFDLIRAVSPLVVGGWLDCDTRNPNAPRWKLRPGVAEAMRARRETEEREKQALAGLMNSNRRGRRK